MDGAELAGERPARGPQFGIEHPHLQRRLGHPVALEPRQEAAPPRWPRPAAAASAGTGSAEARRPPHRRTPTSTAGRTSRRTRPSPPPRRSPPSAAGRLGSSAFRRRSGRATPAASRSGAAPPRQVSSTLLRTTYQPARSKPVTRAPSAIRAAAPQHGKPPPLGKGRITRPKARDVVAVRPTCTTWPRRAGRSAGHRSRPRDSADRGAGRDLVRHRQRGRSGRHTAATTTGSRSRQRTSTRSVSSFPLMLSTIAP